VRTIRRGRMTRATSRTREAQSLFSPFTRWMRAQSPFLEWNDDEHLNTVRVPEQVFDYYGRGVLPLA
jgi:hypothetical protein